MSCCLIYALPVVLLMSSLQAPVPAAKVPNEQQQSHARVQCYTCEADMTRETYQSDHPCLFPKDPKDMVTCSENSNFCQVDITRVGGALLTLDRRCVTECEEKCSEKGFGIVRETCTYCCHDNPACAEIRS